MSKFLVVTFPNEAKAYDGTRALRELHNEGSISLYGVAVVTRDSSGAVSVKETADQGPVGTALGAVVGGLVGLIAGPIGGAIGLGYGGLIGNMADLLNLGVGADFIEEVSRRLAPGKTAIVAEVDEDWITPINTRMAAIGGTVLRQWRADVEDEMVEKDIQAARTDVAMLRAELAEASNETKASVKAQLDNAEANLKSLSQRANDQVERLKKQTEARMKQLQEQRRTARTETKAKVDAHIKEVQAEFQARSTKLGRAWELTKDALRP
jgi:uncharacterized membrane protein